MTEKKNGFEVVLFIVF